MLECSERRAGRDLQADRNYNLYLGNHFLEVAPDESARYVFNRIKTVVISHAAIQNGTRPSIKFSPRQSDEYGECYINLTALQQAGHIADGGEVAAILQQIPPECQGYGPNGEFPQPLPPPAVSILKQAIAQGEMLVQQAQAQGMPPPQVIPAEALVEVNDATASAALQIAFDTKWDECGADFYVIENALMNGIIGWQHMLYQWDEENKNHVLFNAEFRQVFLDTTRTDISKSQYAVFDYIMSAEQGMAEYPDFAKDIAADSSAGRPTPAGGNQYQRSAMYTNTIFRRNMFELRTAWVRHQPYPMSTEEALRRKLVVTSPVPVAAPALPAPVAPTGVGTVAVGDEKLPTVNDDSDKEFADQKGPLDDLIDQTPATDATATPPPAPAADSVGAVGDMGGVGDGGGDIAGGAVGAAPAMRQGYFLVGPDGQATQQEVQPWGPDWPLRMGIREIRIIAGKVVQDRECEFVDIPLPHNVNFPILNTPWGQGTPEDMEHLNMAFNEFLSDIIAYLKQNTFPTQMLPDSVNNARPSIARNAYVKPGSRLTVPDDLWERWKGELMKTLQPGALNADMWKILDKIGELIDKQGEMSQVLNGEAAPGWSGDAIGKLQNAAAGSIMFRSKRTETMLKYLAKLMTGSILYKMTPEDLASHIRKYPVYIWYSLHAWMRDRMAFDIVCEISSGGGANKTAQNQAIEAIAQSGGPISPQTRIEAVGKDPDTELQNITDWQRKLQASQLQPPPNQQATGPAPKEQSAQQPAMAGT